MLLSFTRKSRRLSSWKQIVTKSGLRARRISWSKSKLDRRNIGTIGSPERAEKQAQVGMNYMPKGVEIHTQRAEIEVYFSVQEFLLLCLLLGSFGKKCGINLHVS